MCGSFQSRPGIYNLVFGSKQERLPNRNSWHMKRGAQYYKNAYDSLCQLRASRLQAARDLFYIHCLLYAEREIQSRHHRLFEVFSQARNRRALQASVGRPPSLLHVSTGLPLAWTVVMFMQQFCGVNTIVHVRPRMPSFFGRMLFWLFGRPPPIGSNQTSISHHVTMSLILLLRAKILGARKLGFS